MRAWLALTGLFVCAACGGNGTGPDPTPTPTPTVPVDYVLVGAGDISGYGPQSGPESTATLLDAIPGTVFTTGDNVNTVGTYENFLTYFDPTWGRHFDRIRPCPGNHDYEVAGAAGYFQYFGSNAGPSGRGYYSYNLGSWHVISLNSEVPMTPGSAQGVWLAADLAASTAPCVLAYWHEPLRSSNSATENPATADLWRALYRAGAEIVLNGHNHAYERFLPMNPDGGWDLQGIQEFVVGTGGATLYGVGALHPMCAVSRAVHGVLKLTLSPGSYTWEFVPVAGQTFHDSGSGTCH